MSVQITINGENATEAISEFAVLSAAFTGGTTAVTTTKPAELSKSVETTKTEEPKSAASETEQTNTQDESSGGDGAIPTIVELRAKASEVSKAKPDKSNGPKVKALLAEYGYTAVSDIEEKDRVAVMKGLEAI